MTATNLVVVGGGVVGLATARELLRRRPGSRVVVIEKETLLGAHASGRNSGIVHAGIYYQPRSFKARFCVEGAKHLLSFCGEHGLPLHVSGKIIVAKSVEEEVRLNDLCARGKENGAELELIDKLRIQRLEPAAATRFRALYSPRTACIDPHAVLAALADEVAALGGTLHLGAEVRAVDPERRLLRLASGDEVAYDFLINAAGTQADRLAHACGIGRNLRLLPFRGTYFELADNGVLAICGQIYPVPDAAMPFLGIHFTRAISGKVYVGPTALPALGREHYRGLAGIDWAGLPRLLVTEIGQFTSNVQGFRNHALAELGRLTKARFVAEAQRLVPEVRATDLIRSSKVGIRAQLFDLKAKRLVDDFLVERSANALHVLNAVSPGFTSAFALARHLAELVEA